MDNVGLKNYIKEWLKGEIKEDETVNFQKSSYKGKKEIWFVKEEEKITKEDLLLPEYGSAASIINKGINYRKMKIAFIEDIRKSPSLKKYNYTFRKIEGVFNEIIKEKKEAMKEMHKGGIDRQIKRNIVNLGKSPLKFMKKHKKPLIIVGAVGSALFFFILIFLGVIFLGRI